MRINALNDKKLVPLAMAFAASGLWDFIAGMKYLYPKILICAFLIVTLSSCRKDDTSRVGFRSEFVINSKGLTLMETRNNVEFLNLIGKIELKKGRIEVKLLDPEEFAVYSTKVEQPGIFQINLNFRATRGFWKLSYKSIEGEGTIDLHLTNIP